MPGWYIHTEVAKQVVDRLRAGNVPSDFGLSIDEAKQLGNIAYTWRNYLAWGAIGPDIFYLLPDFKPSAALPNLPNDLMVIVNFWQKEWKKFDDLFMSSWGDYAAPAVRGGGAVLNQISGGFLREMGESMQEVSKAANDFLLSIVAHLWDWFGLFNSGVPSGLSEKEFYWSDMFHYRSTYQFAHQMFVNAQTDQQKAFALGWMTHCATDVTGHPFVNEKVGGPWRLHWQRHHLVENHMDARVYDTQHMGVEPYGELDTSCMHFRLAFRQRNDGLYATSDGMGHSDAPAYDYFAGFPGYDGHNPLSGLDTNDSDPGDSNRALFFDMDLGDNSGLDDLLSFMVKTMADVFPGSGSPFDPQILKCTDSEFHNQNSGRPSAQSVKNTFQVLFDYVKITSTSGYSPAPPQPPPVFNDFSPPPFPQPGEDTTRGDDPSSKPNSIVQVFLAAFAFVLWLADFATWLITLPEQVVADLLTYPPRELLYLLAVQPLYSLYLAMRQPLVMSAFMHPKHSEISTGLVQLGVSTDAQFADLVSALASVGAAWPQSPPTSEPSGRVSATGAAEDADASYPRAIIEDNATLIAKLVGYPGSSFACYQQTQASEFLRPWLYPVANNAMQPVGSELPAPLIPGPWTQGQSAEVLMNTSPGDPATRQAFENAKTASDAQNLCEKHFPAGQHLGDPVDYSVYLIGKLANTAANTSIPPDFNLDSDRGYGYHTWDWNRFPTPQQACAPNTKDCTTIDPPICPAFGQPPNLFEFQQPCTVPEAFCNPASTDIGPHYQANDNLSLHFVPEKDPGCPNFMIQEKKPK